jgi:3-isopropylmalate/(R)-2-methylmalate dehydratase small subunit
MEKFTVLKGRAAPMPLSNIDTDMIIPKQFLKTIKRTGLGIHAFDEMRYDENGKELEDFVLNKAPYRNAEILIAGENFGCGSSREHAPWALLDFGIRCVISTSFADIFFGNCFKNGILPLKLKQEEVDTLMAFAENGENEITVDLENKEVRAGNHVFAFDVDDFRRHCLLNGLDDIGLTLQQKNHIDDYEQQLQNDKPWLIQKA